MRMAVSMLGAILSAAAVYAEPAMPPYEVVRDHVAVEVAADGSYVETRDVAYRVLDRAGLKLLQERRLSYTQGFETIEIADAYTLKADGRRIDVPPGNIVSGYGQALPGGFSDNQTISLIFPDLAVGDRTVLRLRHKLLVPWFPGQFAIGFPFSRTVPSHNRMYSVTVPEGMALKIDAVGLTGGEAVHEGGTVRRVWRFADDAPEPLENDAVSEADFAPHLSLTTFADYGEVAKAYRIRARYKTRITPEIAALAERLTRKAADKREEARLIYEWVASHITYVAIELGSNGFTPHTARNVLANRLGDCKDHAALLEALLAVKKIKSTAALIRIGDSAYTLPSAASPHAFDHVITYLPAFDLFVDSSSELAPFGTLPYADAGKPVILIADGQEMRTPVPTSAQSQVKAESTVEISADGSATGHTELTASGAVGLQIRRMVQSIDVGRENGFLRKAMGLDVEGTIARGKPASLRDPYAMSFDYRMPGALVLPEGALSPSWSPLPVSLAELVAGQLPPSRGSDYVCPSLTVEDAVKLVIPGAVRFSTIPEGKVLEADGIRLAVDYRRMDPHTLLKTTALRIDHPSATCSPSYYAGMRGRLVEMTELLSRQVRYRSASE
jgi:transglutaminase-like putative cysteine protease